MRRSINSAPIATRVRVAEKVLTMLKTFTYPLTTALLLLVGCSKMNDNVPNNAEVSCDLCHTTPLNQMAVHRLHLSNLAMANFPFKDMSAAANYKVDTASGVGDSTFRIRVNLAVKFSDSATNKYDTRYQQTRLLNEGIQCADCHRDLDPQFRWNNDPNHRKGGVADVFFNDSLLVKHYNASDTAHYLPSAPVMSFDGTSCSNIVCHGGGRKNLQNVVWKPSPKLTDTLTCMACHNTANHKVGVSCNNCHLDVTLDFGKTIHNFRKHFNDTINFKIQ